MDAYSMDLRERVVAACDDGTETREEVAERFGVSTSFIRKLLRRRRQSDSVAPKPHAGGVKPTLKPKDLKQVRTLVRQQPDATLEELCQRLAQRTGKSVRVWTMCRALQALDLSRKKSPCTPANATPPASGGSGPPGGRRWPLWPRTSLCSWTRAGPPRA
jgi:transposase